MYGLGRMASAKLELCVHSKFVMRSPLLDFDVLRRWADGMRACSAPDSGLDAAVEADRQVLRSRLRYLVDVPEIQEALFLASPSLERGLKLWRSDPESERAQKVERSLIRYLVRMATRPSPFGLFSGSTVGRLAGTTNLVLGARVRHRRHTRLDSEYLAHLTEALSQRPAVREGLQYFANSTLFGVFDRIHYTARSDGASKRTYGLASVRSNDYLTTVLERARGGATMNELAKSLSAYDPEVTEDEAKRFVEDMISCEMLVSDLEPAITGPDPTSEFIERLRRLSDDSARRTAEQLALAVARLEELDDQVGNPVAHYDEVLSFLPPPPHDRSPFHVTLCPLGDLTLSAEVADEALRCVQVLSKLSRTHSDYLASFRQSFLSRYGEREVPLLEALDEEAGIGLNSESVTDDGSGLLDGLPFAAPSPPSSAPWGEQLSYLARRIADTIVDGAMELVLSEHDLERLAFRKPAPIPDTFSMAISIGERDGSAYIALIGIYEPPSTKLLGRFCHSDQEMLDLVREHIEIEEGLRPDTVFAEVVHAPQARHGNVVTRPALRAYELPLLGRSGAPRAQQIALTDLFVSVRGDKVILRSSALGREVVPRITTAHNFSQVGLPLYRFLGHVQVQGVCRLHLDLGPLDALPFVPQVRYGRIVLRPARWLLTKRSLEAFVAGRGGDRVRAIRELRSTLRLPRWVAIEDGEGLLTIDLDNILALDNLAHLAKGRDLLAVRALCPAPEHLAAKGDGGRFMHEAILLIHRVAASGEARRPVSVTRRADPQASSFAPGPGSEWFYARLFCGQAAVDELISEVLRPMLIEHKEWFFIRYDVPSWHLRLRFRCSAARYEDLARQLRSYAGPALANGKIWTMELATYERELETYGGALGVKLSERFFWADSMCAADLLCWLSGGTGRTRWLLTVRGTDQLLDDLGFDVPSRHALVAGARDAIAAGHFSADSVEFRRALGDRYRREKAGIYMILNRAEDGQSQLAPALARFAWRSGASREVSDQLRAGVLRGDIERSLEHLALRYMHLHINRMLRGSHRAHELVIYDFLARVYESQLARAQG